jgi:hypothetical protein
MHGDRRGGSVRGDDGVGHGPRPYRRTPRAASVLALLVASAVAPGVAAADAAVPLRPDGGWRTFTVSAPGQRAAYAFETVAGARYRVTAQPVTLARAVFELGRGRETWVRADGGGPGAEAVHEFYA